MKKLAPVITIDGPSGVGKSVLCKKISQILKWNCLESGLIYRLVAWIIIKNKISFLKKDILVLSRLLDVYLIDKKYSIKHVFDKIDLKNTLNIQKNCKFCI